MSTLELAPDSPRHSPHVVMIMAAVGAWFLSVLFTFSFLRELSPTLGFWWGIALSMFIQSIMTLAERPLWKWIFKRKNGRVVGFGVAILLIDGIINGAGIFPYLPGLQNTSLGKMLTIGLGLSPTIGGTANFIIALILGVVSAGLAEYLWEL